jgi:hypothetical protein
VENSPEVWDSREDFFEGPPARRGFVGPAAAIVLGPLILLFLALARSFFTFPPPELVVAPPGTVGVPLVLGAALLTNR